MSKASELRLLQGRRSIDAPVRFHNRSGDSEEAGSMLDYYARSESAEEEYLAEADEEAKGVFVKAFQLYLKKTLSGKERRFLRRILSGKEKPQEIGRALGVKWFDYMQEIQRKAFNNAEAFGRVVRLSGWSRAEAFAGTVFARFRALRERGEREELPREKKQAQAQARAMMKAFRESSETERRTARSFYRAAHREERYEYNKRYLAEHREECRAYFRAYEEARREERNARRRELRAKNREETRAKDRALRARLKERDPVKYAEQKREKNRRYREANAEKLRKYREANAEKERERRRKYREANREKDLERKRVYRAKKKAERESAKALAGLLFLSQTQGAETSESVSAME